MREALEALLAAVEVQYRAAPALLLGLSMLAGMPALILLGALVRGVARLRRGSGLVSAAPATGRGCPAWPTEAWLELAPRSGAGAVADGIAACGRRIAIGEGLLRIGRESDNDACLGDDTVHRYHAAFHRTSDAEVLVTDLSSAEGNGVLLNGRRIGAARLKDGDTIGLGNTQVTFRAAPLASSVLACVSAARPGERETAAVN